MDLTRALLAAYDSIRRAALTEDAPLRLLDDDGALIGSREFGWYPQAISGEESGRRSMELRVLAYPDDIDFSDAVFFEFGGHRYERDGFPDPPVGNPREYVWRLAPVGAVEEITQ